MSKQPLKPQLDETTKKLILLYVLDQMEIPLTEESIMAICTNRNDWLEYLDCKEAMQQLIDVGFICKIETNGFDVDPKDERYTITIDGRNCVANFFNRIDPKTSEDIANFAKQNRMVFKRSQEYLYEYFKNNDGTHTVVFRIKEPEMAQPMFEIRIKTSTRSAAVAAGKKWHKKAAQIYEYVFDNLISDN